MTRSDTAIPFLFPPRGWSFVSSHNDALSSITTRIRAALAKQPDEALSALSDKYLADMRALLDAPGVIGCMVQDGSTDAPALPLVLVLRSVDTGQPKGLDAMIRDVVHKRLATPAGPSGSLLRWDVPLNVSGVRALQRSYLSIVPGTERSQAVVGDAIVIASTRSDPETLARILEIADHTMNHVTYFTEDPNA